MTPNPDFEHFVRDYLRLAGKEKSRELLELARDWMHAAMQDRPQVRPSRRAVR
jgi:hypothetical protein